MELPSPSDTVTAVRKIAAENPDGRYIKVSETSTSCYYGMGGDGKGCIIGQAWESLGVSLETLTFIDKHYSPLGVVEMYLPLDNIADVNWLADVQDAQDGGSTFGDAVKIADGVL